MKMVIRVYACLYMYVSPWHTNNEYCYEYDNIIWLFEYYLLSRNRVRSDAVAFDPVLT